MKLVAESYELVRLLWMPAATSSCVDVSQTEEGAVLKADDSETDSDEEREVVQFLVNQTEWISHSELARDGIC